ncbi:uncharacterized protein LOC134668654 [Cydia fagiglandana]|uniref:uncharacterized protein LOC134668654 n=1 Tax=Cydia fagiglandana TaxID=1458189 RepID=UPI002FEE1A5F
MSQELPGLLAEQENICGLILKAQANFKKTPKARLTRGYIKTRKESIEQYFSQFVENNRALIKISTPSDKAKYEYFKDDLYSACEEMFLDLKAEMTDMLESSTTGGTSTSSTNPTPSTSRDDVKLPKIDIAKFTGNYQDWTSFYDMFTSLIHNKENLSSVQKMHYLKSYLSGEPAQLLDHLAVTETNYELAWLTLQNRYNNKRVIVNSILSKLMNQKKIHTGTAKAIREILDTTMECLNKLKVQNINTSSCDTLIIHIIVEKLETETHKEWEEEASNLNLTELPTMVMFNKFLEKRFRVLEMMQPSQTTNMNMKSTYRSTQREPNVTVVSKSFHVSPAIKCGFCKLNHHLNQCKEFQELTLEKKTEFIQNQQLCFNCLIHGHAVRFCKSKFSCQKCGRRHHTLLHNNTYQSKEKEHKEETKQEREPKDFKRERETKLEPKQDMKNKREIVAHLTTGSMTGLLSTAQINVTNHQGREFVLRALLDPCSQESFLNESAAQTMGLKRKRVNGNVSGLDQMSTPIRFAADIEISSRHNPEKKMSLTTYIVKRVTNIMPSEKLTIDNWVHLKDLQLADPTYHQPSSIDILLGVEVYNEMIQPGLIKGVPGSPIALQTHLGWIISGKVTVGTEQEREEKPFISMHLNVELNHMLKRFWELETIDEEKHKLTAEEIKVEEIYEKTTTRDEDGRYIVDLPMRHDPPVLPSNSREIALKRWKSTENRLKSKPHLLEEYNKVLEEYITLNHMKKIENKDEDNGVWLAQFAVIKWKPFVKNRVLEITEILDANHWFYVNTKQNPADPASRGVMPSKLMSTEIWWNGPEMLKEKEIRLEKGTPLDTAIEKRKNIVTMVVTNENEEQLTLLKKFSSLEKLTRVIAYCRRWLKIIDREKSNLPSYLTYEERNDALTICIRMSQEVEFSEEIEDLKGNRNLKPKSNLLALSPFLDDKNVLRVGGRLKHADMEFIRKHPIIISKNNVLLPLILREAHAKTLHGPPQMMITYLRGKYWLINAASRVKRFVRECVTCIRQNAKNREQKMGDLPDSRVKPCRPFLVTGTDFAGPIHVRMSKGRGAKSYKAYICLFVCMCTKALHIEVVSDMTTQAFLAAFKRFVSRRGHVAEMWSDHGTSFIGTEKELLEMWSQGKSSVPDEFISMLDREGTK